MGPPARRIKSTMTGRDDALDQIINSPWGSKAPTHHLIQQLPDQACHPHSPRRRRALEVKCAVVVAELLAKPEKITRVPGGAGYGQTVTDKARGPHGPHGGTVRAQRVGRTPTDGHGRTGTARWTRKHTDGRADGKGRGRTRTGGHERMGAAAPRGSDAAEAPDAHHGDSRARKSRCWRKGPRCWRRSRTYSPASWT